MALSKPDPSRYRGGSTSSIYKQDLARWEATQTPEPEEVVSLDSAFDTEADSFLTEYDFSSMDLSSLGALFPEGSSLGEGVTEERLEGFGVQLQEDMLAGVGKTREDFDEETLADPIKFNTEYQKLLTEQNQENRNQLYSLYKEDGGDFQEAYDSAPTNSQLSFLHKLYNEDTLSRDKYLELSAQVLTAKAPEPLTYFVQNNKLYQVPTTFTDDDSALFFAREVVLFPEQEHGATSEHYLASDDENFLRALGSINDESADTRSSWVKARDSVIVPMARTAASLATGGQSEQFYSAVKLASGETLHGSDYANLALGGLEQAGVITPDATTIDPATGQEIIVPGTGLGSLTYDQTTGLIDAIGNQDVLGAALALEGDNLITDNLEAIGIPPALATDPDFIEGTKAALETAIEGGDFQEALEDGLVEYITEGGGFGGVPDIDVGDLSSVLDPIVDVVENVGDALQPVFDGVEDVAQVVGDIAEDVLIDPADDIIDLLGSEVVDPILQTVEPVAEVVEDTIIDPIDDALDYVGSEFVDPTLQTAEDVAQEVGDVIEDVGQGVGDVVENIVEAIPDVDLPSIDLPSIDLNLPQVTMPSFMPAQREATRTTDTLFKDMLQFETEITEAPRLQIPTQQPVMPVAQVPTTPMQAQTNILGQFLQPTQRLLTGRRV